MVLEIASTARSEVTRKHLFQYIHSRFLDYRLMPKLLHFQTYDVALIPQMVERVPSMHMCYEFIPELLSQPRFSQQMFALRVAVHIFRKYPLRKGLEITKGAIFQYFERYLSNKATPAMVAHQLEFSIVMIQTVGAVVRLFPEVEEYALYVIQLLVEFNRGIDGSPDAEDEQGYGGGGTARDRCTEWKRQVQSMLIDLRSMLTEGGFRLFRDLDVIVCTPGSRSGGNGSANSGGQKRNVPLSDQATEYLKDGGTLAKANGKPPQ
ncbi:Integrator complex subunit 2, partial [Spiromyces aspiralis]